MGTETGSHSYREGEREEREERRQKTDIQGKGDSDNKLMTGPCSFSKYLKFKVDRGTYTYRH